MRNSRSIKSSLLIGSFVLASMTGAQAAGFTVVHSFVGGTNDGARPIGGVTPAGSGSFYIATDGGGTSDKGTLALLHKDGTTQVLHSFVGGSDGQNADGTPVQWSEDGSIYGTTQFGGTSGCGTVYKYVPGTGTYQQVYSLGCAPDGAFPYAGLADTGLGYLLGTAYNGGNEDAGRLVYVNTKGAGSSCQFTATKGAHPYGSIVSTASYTYATTTSGGSANLGTLTAFYNENCNETDIHDFQGGADGAKPYGALLLYKGALYGTASGGGSPGLGVVFKINADGSKYSVLHTFQGINQNSDGSFPYSGLTLNKEDGMLYGTTINGGNATDLGTVFKIDPKTGTETVVHAFSGNDGAHPYGNLYIKKGTIYGTTSAGGASNLGVVFKLKT